MRVIKILCLRDFYRVFGVETYVFVAGKSNKSIHSGLRCLQYPLEAPPIEPHPLLSHDFHVRHEDFVFSRLLSSVRCLNRRFCGWEVK